MPCTLKNQKFVHKNLSVAYVHIEYSTYQISEETKGGGGNHRPYGNEKSVVLWGLIVLFVKRE